MIVLDDTSFDMLEDTCNSVFGSKVFASKVILFTMNKFHENMKNQNWIYSFRKYWSRRGQRGELCCSEIITFCENISCKWVIMPVFWYVKNLQWVINFYLLIFRLKLIAIYFIGIDIFFFHIYLFFFFCKPVSYLFPC